MTIFSSTAEAPQVALDPPHALEADTTRTAMLFDVKIGDQISDVENRKKIVFRTGRAVQGTRQCSEAILRRTQVARRPEAPGGYKPGKPGVFSFTLPRAFANMPAFDLGFTNTSGYKTS